MHIIEYVGLNEH